MIDKIKFKNGVQVTPRFSLLKLLVTFTQDEDNIS